MFFFSQFRRAAAGPDLAIDLGTANTRLYAEGRGLIADEPSVIMVRRDTGRVEAVGAGAAWHLLNRRDRRLVAPLRAGVIADVDAASALLRTLFRRVRRLGLSRPRILACVPSDAVAEERSALIEAALRAGVGRVALAPEPLAAAIGIGMDVSSEHAQMIVDIGDGVTDIAVIRSSTLIATAAIRTAYSDLKLSVRQLAAERCGVDLHTREAERLIRHIGIRTARHRDPSNSTCAAAGDDCATGVMRRVRLSEEELAAAMEPVLSTIVGFVGRIVRELPDDIACEVIESGIRLTGGGSLLKGFSELIATETQLDVRRASDPLHSVIQGARQMLAVGIKTDIWSHD